MTGFYLPDYRTLFGLLCVLLLTPHADFSNFCLKFLMVQLQIEKHLHRYVVVSSSSTFTDKQIWYRFKTTLQNLLLILAKLYNLLLIFLQYRPVECRVRRNLPVRVFLESVFDIAEGVAQLVEQRPFKP